MCNFAVGADDTYPDNGTENTYLNDDDYTQTEHACNLYRRGCRDSGRYVDIRHNHKTAGHIYTIYNPERLSAFGSSLFPFL